MKKENLTERIKLAENVFEQLEIMNICYAVCVSDLNARGMTNKYKDYFIIITDLDRGLFLVDRNKDDEEDEAFIGGKKFILNGFKSGTRKMTFERTLDDNEVNFFRKNLLDKFNQISFSSGRVYELKNRPFKKHYASLFAKPSVDTTVGDFN
jgi:hypothetical protein